MKQIFILLALVTMQACYYDNEVDLYPAVPGGGCDTTALSFNTEVWPIIESRCTSCHSGSFPQGNLALTNHSQVVGALADIRDRINRDQGDALLMPQGAKMDACSISKIEAWARQGALNN